MLLLFSEAGSMEEEAGGAVGDEDNQFSLQIWGLIEHPGYKYCPRMKYT